MKYFFVAALALLLTACNSQQGSSKKAELKVQKDSVSYAIGLDVGTTFKRQEITVNYDAFIQGMKDAADSGKRMMNEEQIAKTMMAFQQQMMAQAQEKMKGALEKNKKEGEAFLAENKKQPGVVTTASGLQYKVITMGKGPKPKASNEVTVHYRGTLLNGTEFDNSYKRGEPVTFPCGGVIKGWTEVLQLMPVGSKWQVWVPSDLGYGERSAGQIGPNSTLVFDVELLAIKK